MKTYAPYLDIIDSEKYLELGWYYANPTDSDKEKELSQDHAKKAYQLSRRLMGDEGGKMVAEMLSNQIIKNRVIGGQKVELAKCEFYSYDVRAHARNHWLFDIRSAWVLPDVTFIGVKCVSTWAGY